MRICSFLPGATEIVYALGLPRLVQGLEIIAEILHPELFSGYIPANGAAWADHIPARIG
jgi:hypothetical protein